MMDTMPPRYNKLYFFLKFHKSLKIKPFFKTNFQYHHVYLFSFVLRTFPSFLFYFVWVFWLFHLKSQYRKFYGFASFSYISNLIHAFCYLFFWHILVCQTVCVFCCAWDNKYEHTRIFCFSQFPILLLVFCWSSPIYPRHTHIYISINISYEINSFRIPNFFCESTLFRLLF